MAGEKGKVRRGRRGAVGETCPGRGGSAERRRNACERRRNGHEAREAGEAPYGVGRRVTPALCRGIPQDKTAGKHVAARARIKWLGKRSTMKICKR